MHQAFYVNLRVVDVSADGVANLSQVVGSHVCCHTYGNTGRTVEQKERSFCGKYGRLLNCVVKVELEVYCILVYVCENFFCKFFKLSLCVTHGCNGVTVH